eukprot:Pompholyxophrys_punicea_v1_NODE_27_length_5184_cov_24.170599.p2 type:complete len:103 gc:universal NODE_27_length_5184_cov_24.170599:2069-2377(+)
MSQLQRLIKFFQQHQQMKRLVVVQLSHPSRSLRVVSLHLRLSLQRLTLALTPTPAPTPTLVQTLRQSHPHPHPHPLQFPFRRTQLLDALRRRQAPGLSLFQK